MTEYTGSTRLSVSIGFECDEWMIVFRYLHCGLVLEASWEASAMTDDRIPQSTDSACHCPATGNRCIDRIHGNQIISANKPVIMSNRADKLHAVRVWTKNRSAEDLTRQFVD